MALISGAGFAASGMQSLDTVSGDPGPYFHTDKGSPLFENGWQPDPTIRPGNLNDYHPGSSLDTAIGWNFNRLSAAELEFGYAKAGSNSMPGFSMDNAHVANVPLLANFTFTLPRPNARVVPYLGAGAGGDDVLYNPNGFTDGSPANFGNASDMVFAWQAFAGLHFRMNERMSLGFGYKYFATGDPVYPALPNPNAAGDGFHTHSVLLTFQLKF